MKIKSIEIIDTYGSLKEPGAKYKEDQPALSAWFEEEGKKRVLKLSPSNVYFEKLNGSRHVITYKQILQYNGTLSTNSKTFAQTVASSTSRAIDKIAPVLTYSPDGLKLPMPKDADQVVLDLDFHTGQADVLEYREGSLTQGEKTYNPTVWRHSYPTIITSFPNTEDQVVYLDGWYTYTFIRFIDVAIYDSTIEGNFYSRLGMVFKASKRGKIWISGSKVYILPAWIQGADIAEIEKEIAKTAHEVPMEETAEEIKNLRYTTAAAEGVGGRHSRALLDSQLLITDEIRDAIIEEVICTAKNDVSSACDFADWQKLTLKREAAFIMFENGLFRNAQKIIESSRRVCKFRPNREC